MNQLQASLQICFSNTFLMYYKAHTYHWNVEGKMFAQYHQFFSDIYTDLFGAIDPLAEHIRVIEGYAPVSLSELVSNSTIREDVERLSTVSDMLRSLQESNDLTLASLNKTFELAVGNNGLQNFLADRIDIHAKHGWMLKSSLKTTE